MNIIYLFFLYRDKYICIRLFVKYDNFINYVFVLNIYFFFIYYLNLIKFSSNFV